MLLASISGQLWLVVNPVSVGAGRMPGDKGSDDAGRSGQRHQLLFR
jgi:hypothetical protein